MSDSSSTHANAWHWIGIDDAEAYGRAAVARLVGNVQEFLEGGWGRQPVHVRRDPATSFEDLLNVRSVDELVAGVRIRYPLLSLTRESDGITEAGTRASFDDVAPSAESDTSQVLRRFANGETLILNELHRSWHPVTAFCDAVALGLGHKVQCNAYITPPRSVGFGRHYDTHDVFVLQISGEKRWKIWKPAIEKPLPDQRFITMFGSAEQIPHTELLLDIVLQPGDVLYLPRGFTHSPSSLDTTSIHLTIGILSTTWFHLFRRTLEQDAALDVAFRESTEPSLPSRIEQHSFEVKRDNLTAAFSELVGNQAQGHIAEFWRTRTVPTGGRFEQILLSQNFSASTEFHRPVHCVLRYQDTNEALVLEGIGTRVSLPNGYAELVLAALDGEQHTIGELAEVYFQDSTEVHEIVQSLVHVGYLELSGDGDVS